MAIQISFRFGSDFGGGCGGRQSALFCRTRKIMVRTIMLYTDKNNEFCSNIIFMLFILFFLFHFCVSVSISVAVGSVQWELINFLFYFLHFLYSGAHCKCKAARHETRDTQTTSPCTQAPSCHCHRKLTLKFFKLFTRINISSSISNTRTTAQTHRLYYVSQKKKVRSKINSVMLYKSECVNFHYFQALQR